MSHNMSLGQNWTRNEKEYSPSHCTFDAKILIAYVQGGDLSARKRILEDRIFD